MMKKLSYCIFFALLLASCGDNDSSATGAEQLESLSSNTDIEYLSSSAETSSTAESSSAKETSSDKSSSSKTENSSSSVSAGSSSSQAKESSSSATTSSATTSSSNSTETSSSSEDDLSSSSEIDLSQVTDEENTEGLVCKEEGEKAKGVIDTSRTYYCHKDFSELKWFNMDRYFLTLPTEEYVNKDYQYGTMTDPRDGQTYRTTKIGNQIWMAENLKFGKFTNGEPDAVLVKNLYNENGCNLNNNSREQYASDCEQYGRRYSWTAAMNLNFQLRSIKVSEREIWLEHQGVCPEGWHIPNNADWQELINFIKSQEGEDNVATSLQSAHGWGPGRLDKYGFTAFPIFVQYFNLLNYYDGALFWSVDEYNTAKYEERFNYAYILYLKKNSVQLAAVTKEEKLYVRCIQNRGNVETLDNDTTGLLSHTFERDQIFSSNAQYGSFKDERDGTVYKTVVIGDQEWFAENLNYKAIYGSSCYNNKAANCEVYGRLYSRKTAMAAQNELYRDVCPIGWHIPSNNEWKILTDYVASQTDTPVGTALKSSVGFSCNQKGCATPAPTGTNEFGFSAIGAGWNVSGRMANEGVVAKYWISDQPKTSKEFLFRTETLDDYRLDGTLSFDLSVRCLKN